ncbi:MAG TPA: hypothetical protein VF591_14045 [Pyrinomonadaceae bacterium]|jgi:hypothetical protein
MKVFVSWSGILSQKVALFLKEWFPNVIQSVELYVSSEDIDKGARWFAEVGAELEGAQFGILCLTRENMKAPWVLFEAGAISKTVTQSRVTPLLIDLSLSELKGPLVQFQATTATESDIKKLVRTINACCDAPLKETQLERVFNKWWPDLEQFLQQVASTIDQTNANTEERDERELLEEVLLHVRTIVRIMPGRIAQPLPVSFTRRNVRFITNNIKRRLEELGKPLLAIALDGAHNITIEEDELHIDFSSDANHLRVTLMKPEHLRMLRDVAVGVIGRNIGISVGMTELANNDKGSDDGDDTWLSTAS